MEDVYVSRVIGHKALLPVFLASYGDTNSSSQKCGDRLAIHRQALYKEAFKALNYGDC